MSKIVLNVKNSEVLKEYFHKFNSMSTTIFIVVKKDRFVSYSFTDERDFIKIASLKFSDVFDCAEIDIPRDIYIGLFSKIKRLVMSVSQFSGEYKLILNIKEVTESSIVNLIKSAGYTEDSSIDVVEFLQFKDSRLNLITKGTKFTVIKEFFKMTTSAVQSIFGDADSTLNGSFILEKNDFKQLKTLADAVENKDSEALDFSVDTEKCKIHISSTGSFDFKFPMTECVEAIEFPIGRDSLKRFDAENLEVTIKNHNIKGPILVMSSQESDTKYCCSTYKKPQR